MRNKTVEDKYKPLHSVYMLDINRKLDKGTMKEVRLLCSKYSPLKGARLALDCEGKIHASREFRGTRDESLGK